MPQDIAQVHVQGGRGKAAPALPTCGGLSANTDCLNRAALCGTSPGRQGKDNAIGVEGHQHRQGHMCALAARCTDSEDLGSHDYGRSCEGAHQVDEEQVLP